MNCQVIFALGVQKYTNTATAGERVRIWKT